MTQATRTKREAVTVRCIDASKQPLLVEGAVYTVVADIESATTKDGENKTGLIIREAGSSRALPYLYRKSRFSICPKV